MIWGLRRKIGARAPPPRNGCPPPPKPNPSYALGAPDDTRKALTKCLTLSAPLLSGLDGALSKYCGPRRLREELSAFLHHLPGNIDRPATGDSDCSSLKGRGAALLKSSVVLGDCRQWRTAVADCLCAQHSLPPALPAETSKCSVLPVHGGGCHCPESGPSLSLPGWKNSPAYVRPCHSNLRYHPMFSGRRWQIQTLLPKALITADKGACFTSRRSIKVLSTRSGGGGQPLSFGGGGDPKISGGRAHNRKGPPCEIFGVWILGGPGPPNSVWLAATEYASLLEV